ncbi:hypothetical protein GCM10029963_50390 [Micromonospora andamanensis]
MAGADHRSGAAHPRGVRRIHALHEARIEFYAGRVLPGGCFFATTEFEFNARPGAVRDRLAEVFAAWTAFLERLVTEAVELGELPPPRMSRCWRTRSTRTASPPPCVPACSTRRSPTGTPASAC